METLSTSAAGQDHSLGTAPAAQAGAVHSHVGKGGAPESRGAVAVYTMAVYTDGHEEHHVLGG